MVYLSLFSLIYLLNYLLSSRLYKIIGNVVVVEEWYQDGVCYGRGVFGVLGTNFVL